ncbi:MAG: Flp family type IVb pilin [Actinobacteria bacterium]|nr:Flp family type IVb pilin [Actinomycetota bacterium]
MVALKLWFEYQLAALRDEEGAAAVEYGLLVGLIAVATIVTVTLLGGQLNQMFTTVTNAIPSAFAT